MATPQELKRETDLLEGLGLPRVRVWPARCDWYTSNGELRKNLACDPYSRILWLSRGMRRDIWHNKKPRASRTTTNVVPEMRITNTLLDAVVGLGNWEGTGTDLYSALELVTDDIPDNPSRLSRDIGDLAEQLQVRGVTFKRVRDSRGSRMVFRQTKKESATSTVTRTPSERPIPNEPMRVQKRSEMHHNRHKTEHYLD